MTMFDTFAWWPFHPDKNRCDTFPQADLALLESVYFCGIIPLQEALGSAKALHLATWRSGYATVCKTVYSGSIPDVASIPS